MASKLLNNWKEDQYALIQIELLYIDSQRGGRAIGLQFAVVFADKYLAALQSTPATNFCNLYLKLLLAKKEFAKAEAFLKKYQDAFQLWVERGIWIARIEHAKGEMELLMNHLEAMLVQNYEMKNNEFQSIYYLHEYLISLAVRHT